MGNFISKAWDKLTGADQAKKAAKVQQEALAQQKAEAEKSDALKTDVLAKYDELIPMIMGMITGQTDFNSNPMAAQSYNIIQQIVNGLTGNGQSQEQIKANQMVNDYIEDLSKPYSPTDERIKADELIDQYVESLKNPVGVSPEQQQAYDLQDNLIKMLTNPQQMDDTAEKTANEWNTKYLNSLANSPDTAFNAGVSELARGIQNQNENIAKAMQNRGISSSGINVAALGSTAADKAKGMSQLQGQRVDRQVANNGIGAEYATGLADRARKQFIEDDNRRLDQYGLATDIANSKAQNVERLGDKQLTQLGTASGILDERANRSEELKDKYLGYKGQAVGLAQDQASQKINDLIQGLNLTNNWNQQNWNNLMGLLSGKTSLINNQAGANYAQGLNNLADSYNTQATNQAGLLGTVGGKFLTSNTGKKLVSQAGTAALGGIQNVLGLVGGQKFAGQAISGITRLLGLI